MLQQKIQQAREEDGFTLIELLVVILIIGILAAIALPTFLGQSNKAKDSSAKSEARNAVSQIESCLADGTADGTKCAKLPTASETAANTTGNWDLKQFKRITIPAAAADTYTVTALSDSGNKFSIQKEAPGGYTRSCSIVGGKDGAGCPSEGASW